MTNTVARPPFDPELQGAYEALAAQTPLIMTIDMVPATREAGTFFPISDEDLMAMGVVRQDISIPGYEGEMLEASVFSRIDRSGPGPGIFHVHGGGMVTGDRMIGMLQMLPWVVEHDAVVVTAEYRLAPEFPDPYPVEDCYAGLEWMAEHTEELGIDSARMFIAGASAGGGLAAGTALLARDRQGPALLGQVLICPMLDDRNDAVSSHQYHDIGTWVTESNAMGWSALLGNRRGTDAVSIYASPARATDLSGLPPAYIECGSAELFRDEDVAYASSLWASGVQAELHVWAGGYHGYDMIVPDAKVSQATAAARNDWFTRQLSS